MSREEANEGRARCYELLGVAPGATEREVKAAYRDLAKVWHPDRFTHDPRLQAKAQEKLKEINEAYQRALAGPPPPRAARAPRTYARPTGDDAQAARDDARQSPPERRDPARTRVKFGWWLLAPALVFCATFAFVTPRLLSTLRAPNFRTGETVARPPHTEPEAAETRAANAAVVEDKGSRPRKSDERAARAESGVVAESAVGVAARPALPTVNVLIDPTTNLLARPGCPNKLRVAYPTGAEPRAHCEAAHGRAEPTPAAEGEKPRNKSPLKSFAGRLASPTTWLGGKDSSGEPAKKTTAPEQSPEQD